MARQAADEVGATLALVSDVGAQGSSSRRVLVVRRALAALVSVGMTGAMGWAMHSEHIHGVRWVPLLLLMSAPLLAAASIAIPRVGAQLLARGIWWSFLLLGGLIAAMIGLEDDGKSGYPCLFTLANAFCLLTVGTTGLDDDGGRFRPAAFRGTLLLAMVLAIADTVTLLWIGTAQAVDVRVFGPLLLVPGMILGVIGLLRLRTWGLLISLTCNLLVVILASTHVLNLPAELRWLLSATAVAQILVPVPMWIAIARRRLPPPDRFRRLKRVVSTAVIVGIAASSVYFTYFYSRPNPFVL